MTVIPQSSRSSAMANVDGQKSRGITAGQDRTVMPSVVSMVTGGDNPRNTAEAAISGHTSTR